jgi:hypothetical protein
MLETGTNRGLLFEIGTQVWNENSRKTFHRWYFGLEVDTWQAVEAAG